MDEHIHERSIGRLYLTLIFMYVEYC